MFPLCSVYDEAAPSGLAPSLAPGWDEGDVRLLDELAHLGMEMVRALSRSVLAHEAALDRGQAEPLDRAQAGKIALDFSRLARSVRITLTLKAQALGAPVPTQGPARTRSSAAAAAAEDDEDLEIPVYLPYPQGPDSPDLDDLEGRRAHVANQIRLSIDHALTWPGLDPVERERLRETIEDRIEREALTPAFIRVSPISLVDTVIDGLGLPEAWRAGLGEDGVFRRWVIARPGDPNSPLTIPDPAEDAAALHERWPRSRPPDTG